MSMYQSLPVGIPNTAQNPKIKIPKISKATALSADVGPANILHKQKEAQSRRIRKTLFRNTDCHSSKEGIGAKNIAINIAVIINNPATQRKFFIVQLASLTRYDTEQITCVEASFKNPF